MAKTELFSRRQVGGMFAVVREDHTTGNIWFVNSATGTNSVGNGQNPDAPFASIDYAVSRVTNNNADRIYVMPGHTEAISAAGTSLGNGGIFVGATLSNGVEIIGLGKGRARPTITWGTIASASMVVAAANITFRNFVFDFSGVDQIVAAISVTGADVAFEDSEFILDNATNKSVILGILTAATAARFRVERCRFLGTAAATTIVTAAIKHEVGIDFVFRGNYFRGKLTQGILNATTILGGLIEGNFFHIYTGTKGIALAAGTTGYGTNNRFAVPSGTSPVVGAGFTWSNNGYSTEALTIGTPTAGAF